MKSHLSVLYAVVAVLSSGCATKYQSGGFSGGFSETQIQPDMFEVRFKGNGYTSRERSSDFCIMRCAEITVENDCSYFEFLNREKSVKKETYTNNNYTTTGTFQTYGNTTYGNFNTYGGGSTTFYKPRNINTIKIYKEKPKDREVLDAAFLLSSLQAKYKMKKKSEPQE